VGVFPFPGFFEVPFFFVWFSVLHFLLISPPLILDLNLAVVVSPAFDFSFLLGLLIPSSLCEFFFPPHSFYPHPERCTWECFFCLFTSAELLNGSLCFRYYCIISPHSWDHDEFQVLPMLLPFPLLPFFSGPFS